MKKIILLILILFIMPAEGNGTKIKQPNVAGQFYTAHPSQLETQIDKFLKNAMRISSGHRVEVMIAPHAGYYYSGQVAAYAYKAAGGHSYKTVVVIAPSHHFPFNGFSVWAEGGFQTPLGLLRVDEEFSRQLLSEDENFFFRPEVFDREHALEVQLPFIQRVFPGSKIVPILAGQPGKDICERMAESLHKIIGEREDVLVVLSSDMSHFHNDAFARKMDKATYEAVISLDIDRFWTGCRAGTMEMCGYVPVTVGLFLAAKRGLRPEVIRYATSAEVGGDRNRVVGYVSIIFYNYSQGQKSEDVGIPPLSLQQKRRLIDLAKETILVYVQTKGIKDISEIDPRLQELEGAFVTIHKHGSLRGCIGNIIGRQPLYLTVRDMAVAACSQDPRFSPVTREELKDIEVEVSVLSKPRVTRNIDEIIMGKHGVIISRGFKSGVFLPQVADETGWTREQFLSYLSSQKAGLPPDAWKDPKTKIEIFTADVFSEKDVR